MTVDGIAYLYTAADGWVIPNINDNGDGDLSGLISTDTPNALTVGDDNKLYVPPAPDIDVSAVSANAATAASAAAAAAVSADAAAASANSATSSETVAAASATAASGSATSASSSASSANAAAAAATAAASSIDGSMTAVAQLSAHALLGGL